MKSMHWLFILVISTSWVYPQITAEDGQRESGGFPGGYIGVSVQFGSAGGIRSKGSQVTLGIAAPFVGSPGVPPFLFPGVVFGKRSFSDGTSIKYVDLQALIFIGPTWVGTGIGRVFSSAGNYTKWKIFAGLSFVGYVRERKLGVKLIDDPAYVGLHLGLALPLFGYLFP